MLRFILGVTQTERVRNEQIRGRRKLRSFEIKPLQSERGGCEMGWLFAEDGQWI